jgi:hypothetical protein
MLSVLLGTKTVPVLHRTILIEIAVPYRDELHAGYIR